MTAGRRAALAPAFLVSTLLLIAASARALPEGEGRAEVESVCLSCHGTRQIERSSGYSEPDWRRLVATMIDLSATPDLEARVAAYLTEHFPPTDGRAPTLVEGPVEIRFEPWVVPTLGQRSRDPVQAPDGSIWWTGQWADLIGRIDPETDEMREYALPIGSRAHSVDAGPDGHIWYLGNGNGTVGRLDPASGEIDVFPMPDPAAKDPHTGIFTEDGRFWFTLQHSNMVGRLDPETREIDLITLDRPASRPYGIKTDSKGGVWVACNGGPCLYRIDPDSMAQARVDLPGEDTHVRRLDVAADDTIWYGNAGAGRLGHYDPATSEIREWSSPSGPDSHPYGLVIRDGVVWYNESGKRPDALVRFDPATERFQSWPIPSSGVYAGILRHARLTEDGDLLIHQSSTNHIIRVSVVDDASGSAEGEKPAAEGEAQREAPGGPE